MRLSLIDPFEARRCTRSGGLSLLRQVWVQSEARGNNVVAPVATESPILLCSQ